LFVRSPRAIALTPAGRDLLPVAERVVKEFAAFHASLRRLRSEEDQYLHIGGASYTIELPERYDLIDGFVREHPKCTLRVDPRSQPEIIASVEEGELDVAIILGYGVDRVRYDAYTRRARPSHGLYPTDLRAIVVERRPVQILIPAEWPLAAKSAIAPEDLRGLAVAMIDIDNAPPLFEPLAAHLESGGAIITVPPEGIPIGVERYGRQNRVAAISIGFYPPTISVEKLLVPRPIEGFSATTDLVVLASHGETRTLVERFLNYAKRASV
ncbi:MAG: LysR substrate-binding domain-containing protein, partial [Hyphomonadaceae bacterium]